MLSLRSVFDFIEDYIRCILNPTLLESALKVLYFWQFDQHLILFYIVLPFAFRINWMLCSVWSFRRSVLTTRLNQVETIIELAIVIIIEKQQIHDLPKRFFVDVFLFLFIPIKYCWRWRCRSFYYWLSCICCINTPSNRSAFALRYKAKRFQILSLLYKFT